MAAGFRCRLGDFSLTSALEALGSLIAGTAAAGFSTQRLTQVEAWQTELEVLATTSRTLQRRVNDSADWLILLEYEIPRRQKRLDAVLLADDLVFVLEFKVGATHFTRADIWQTESYALDLRDFHAGCANRCIVPILLATEASPSVGPAETESVVSVHNLITPVQKVSPSELAATVQNSYALWHNDRASRIDTTQWERAPYRPSLSIVEAAEKLFRQHSVADISHSFASNLEDTSRAIVDAIVDSQRRFQRTICFLTGSPGAGKTLAGLDAVHDPRLRESGRPSSVFLSGNGPLVKVIREALARDRQRAGFKRPEARREVSTFIQNVHAFLREYGRERPSEAPHESAIVFDEAQRAWDRDTFERVQGIAKSEPQLILEIMSRAPGWATVIAIVGGGQEIHKGEAGLAEWGRSLNQSQCAWNVIASREALQGGADVAGSRLFEDGPASHLRIIESTKMHLSESVRSPRARLLSEWVNELLSTPESATLPLDTHDFPIVLTRSLDEARNWLRDRGRQDRRYGLLASSGAIRHRTYGIELSSGFRRAYEYTDWFLNSRNDVRSSMQLEVAATEFECQGLELDWTCVCWGGDFLIGQPSSSWGFRAFRGNKWKFVNQPIARSYITNKYRVLLTRAREGMVIWVPESDGLYHNSVNFEETADRLHHAGIPYLSKHALI